MRTQRARAAKIFDMLWLSPITDLDTSYRHTVTLNGSDASAWANRTGDGVDALQATAANQPDYTATKNGFPVLTFDGVDECMDLAVNAPQPHTLIAVAKYNTTVGQYICDGDSTGDRLALFTTNQQAHGAVVSDAAFGYAALSADTDWHIHRVLADGANTEYQKGDETIQTASAGTATVQNLRIGARLSDDTHLDGIIAKLSIIPRDLTANEIKVVKSSLKAKWNL